MDLGLSGRKAIVCASSQGLGKACALALAQAGVSVVVNGRNRAALDAAAREIRDLGKVEVTAVLADVSSLEGQAALLGACPEPDILVNNNGGPPFRNFRELGRQDLLGGVTMNMVTPIELIQRVIDGMAARQFGRIVNITSQSVKMPLSGLDLSSGARAGLTAFLAGVTRDFAHRNVTINHLLPGSFDTARLSSGLAAAASRRGVSRNRRSRRNGAAPSRQADSGGHPSWARPAPFSAACTPDSSPARTFSWTAANIPPHFEAAR